MRQNLVVATVITLTACGSDPVGPGTEVAPLYNQIVFDSDRDDLNRDIYTMNLDGTNVRRLTQTPFADFCPSVSPDGKRIAFYSSRLGGELALFIMLADGSDPRYVEGHVRSDVCPRWSHSGNRLLFERFVQNVSAPTMTVEIVRTDATHVVTAVPPASIPSADLSPDGSFTVFRRTVNGDPSLTGVFVRSPSTGEETVMSYEGSQPVSWSPDGTTVAYLCNVAPPPQLYGDVGLCLRSPDGKNLRTIDLQTTYVECFALEWSPDSQKVICDGINSSLVDVPTGTVTAFPFGGAGAVRWFGDSRRIAYVVQTEFQKNDIFVGEADGSSGANLTNNSADDSHPSFGPSQ